tara:strand:- start:479 stop:883 length:405 start_codon:yes stop_codon:yes gene_type:complete
LHPVTQITDNTYLMKRTAVLSPVLLLAIAAAVGAGYMPTDDSLRMIDPANVDSLVSSVRSQRQAARHWFDQVVKNFGHQKHHHNVNQANCFSTLTTVLPSLHLYADAHVHRVRLIAPSQPICDWLLNLPPPSNV